MNHLVKVRGYSLFEKPSMQTQVQYYNFDKKIKGMQPQYIPKNYTK